MNSLEKISRLYDGLEVLANMDVSKLLEQGKLVQDIRDVMSSKNLWAIVNDIQNEYFQEKQLAFNQKQKSSFGPNSPEFLQLYSKYQSAAHGVLTDSLPKSNIKYTSPITMKGAQAFNALKSNPMEKRKIKTLPETKVFAEAFNSVFSNRALQIGTAQDPTLISSYIDYSPYIWNYQYYLSIPTLSQSVEMPLNMATRHLPKIESKNKQFSMDIEEYFKRSMFNERKARKMLLYSFMSPRGSLIVPIEEDGHIRFNVFNDTQFTYAASQQYSRIDFHDNETGVSQIFCLGHILQNEVTAHFLCPGFEPIFAIGKNRLYQLKDAAEAVNIYLYTIKVLCIRAQIMIETTDMQGANDTVLAKMKAQTDIINSRLSLNTAVKRPKGSELDILNNNFNEGFAKVSPIIKEYQGALSGVMGENIYGSDTASYAGNNFNLRITNQNVHSEYQVHQLRPIYRYCINTLVAKDKRFQKYESELDSYDFKEPSLYEETDSEKAEVAKKKIENLILMRDYPELEQIFKKEGLLPDEVNLAGLPPRPPENEPT